MAVTSSKKAVVTLPAEKQILITREFDAPRDLVYKAWTTPDLIKRWWSGDRGQVTLADVDLRVGGKWRYVMAADNGSEVGFNGEFREIVPNERIVCTESYEPMADAGYAVNTVTFTEEAGHTILTSLSEYPSRRIRDYVIESGMEGGMQEAFDKLEQVAGSLAKR